MAPRKTTAPASPSKAVAKTNGGAIALPFDYGKYAGVGAEDITADDFLMPFVRVAQTTSPQLSKRGEKYIDGLEAGEFFNISTQRIYGGSEEQEEEDPFVVHVCAKLHAYPEFIPRDKGGGFVGQRAPDDDLVLELRAKFGKFGKLVTDNETELTETYYLYCIVPPDANNPEPEAIVMPFSSTGITPVKQLLMQLKPLIAQGVPIFGPRIRVSSRFTKNPDGEFFVPRLVFDGAKLEDYLLMDPDLLDVCNQLRESVLAGAAKVDHSSFAEAVQNEEDEEQEAPEPEIIPPARKPAKRGAKAGAAF